MVRFASSSLILVSRACYRPLATRLTFSSVSRVSENRIASWFAQRDERGGTGDRTASVFQTTRPARIGRLSAKLKGASRGISSTIMERFC